MRPLRLLCVSVVGLTALLGAQTQNPEITVEELTTHVRILASDQMEGRRAGSPGAQRSAEYIANEFASSLLTPRGDHDTYFQEFEFVAGIELGRKNSMHATVAGSDLDFTPGGDFLPLGFSDAGLFNGGVVFAGYGITSSEKGYDDYEGVDVKGKAVLLLRFHPEGGNPHSEFGRYASLRYKAVKARENGARALLLVTGPADTDRDELLRLSYDQSVGNAGLIAVNLTQEAADRLLASSGQSVKVLQDEINNTLRPRSFPLERVSLRMETDLFPVRRKTANVVGFLEGSDEQLKEEVVVIGAHYDHLGYGGEGSGSLKPDTVAIHNGADDNASGTAGLLELAQFFSAYRSSLKRSMLFIAFSAEELGLLGSAHFVNYPTVPLSSITTMVNMDMIGRMRNRTLIVYGVGTSPNFEAWVSNRNRDSVFVLKLNKDGFGPSDHSSFYAKQIPVFHFFTDLHDDYHRPSDDWEKVNYEDMKQVLEFVKVIAEDVNHAEVRPAYVRVESPRRSIPGRGRRSYTGTIPDFGEQTEGMKLSGVTAGSPADIAGLRAGDVIIRFGNIEIKNLYDYTFALGEVRPGDEVEVLVRRNGAVKAFRVVIGQRN